MEEVKNNEWVEWLQSIVIALLLAFLLRMFVFDVVMVEGSSMHPTLESGDRLIVLKLGYRFRHPEHGDIVVFRNPDNPRVNYIKRVIGVEGDRVEIKDGKVYVNGKALVEPYIAEPTLGEYPETVVPEGTIFVMGDNRNFSRDSRNSQVGFIPLENVVGKAKIRIWPLWSVTILK
ncbi:MAG: signal peptidase I [Caldicoprobacter sp.]|uniref:signal peptidase I n=1 Tax=Caldicoprobacter sp. TaxID=2004500 RepID=UPI001DC55BED|nr:signal peptidase I [Clostridia bacterium]